MISKIARRNKNQDPHPRKISGTAERPRMSVFRSNKGIYVQVIDDLTGNTIVAASSKGPREHQGGSGCQGRERRLQREPWRKGVTEVVFDRNGYLFHGRVKSLADAARKGGLKF